MRPRTPKYRPNAAKAPKYISEKILDSSQLVLAVSKKDKPKPIKTMENKP
jgi:hypothetical protein